MTQSSNANTTQDDRGGTPLQYSGGYDPNPSIAMASDNHKYTQVAILSAGQSFGELSLISHKPRSATIRCIEDCRFAVLSKA